jgi:transcription initiation factor TFIID subunit 5
VSNNAIPLDQASLAGSSGLLSSILPRATTVESFNTAIKLKLGSVPLAEKLRDEVARTLKDDDAATNGVASPRDGDAPLANGHTNGHDASGDVEMASPSRRTSITKQGGAIQSPLKQNVKLEVDDTSDLVSPEPSETLPPQAPLYKIADLKREVEVVREKRKMIRLGPNYETENVGSTSAVTLPSVLAFTLFDNGER